MINSSIKNKTVLLTGAAGHLGREFSFSLAQEKANLILVDKNRSQLTSLQKEIKKKFDTNVVIKVTDLEIFSHRVNLVKYTNKKFKNLDILINNAAFVGSSNLKGWSTKFEKQSINTWQRAIEVNLISFSFIKGFATTLKSLNNHLLLILVLCMGKPLSGHYIRHKMIILQHTNLRVIHLTKWLASTLAPRVNVNCISPGGIFRNQPKNFVKKFLSSTPLNRMAKESDIVGVLLLLCSDQSKYITGQNIIIDGGKTLY